MSVLAEMAAQGKVRDIYDAGEDHLLMVASDRISAFDVVLPNPIPDKGRVLTGLSLFWFDRTKDLVGNHLVSTEPNDFPGEFREHRDELAGRSMLVRKARMLPIECVARGYLSGSGWKEYLGTGAVCGIDLPAGLEESERLPEPIFTPATKAEIGEHDENIDFERMAEIVGDPDLAEALRRLSIDLYRRGAEHALERGIILADTKFEFGRRPDGTLVLGDEVMTPDSSRFWPADGYEPGRSQPSFDKQYVRDWAAASGWDKSPPAPPIPDEVVKGTRARYLDAYERIAGEPLERWLKALA